MIDIARDNVSLYHRPSFVIRRWSSPDPCAPCDDTNLCESGSTPQSCAVTFDIEVISTKCQLTNKLKDDAGFRQRMTNLLQNSKNLNKETGYVVWKGAGGYGYDYIEQSGSQAEIVFSTSKVTSGLIHSHFGPTTLSIFSPQDIRSIKQLLDGGRIGNLNNYFIGVTSYFDTAYLLVITDPSKFASFASSHLTGDGFTNFENNWQNKLEMYLEQIYGIEGAQERAFIDLMDDYNFGMTLFKGNASFTSWNPRKSTSTGFVNFVANDNCN